MSGPWQQNEGVSEASEQEHYLGRVRGLVIALSDLVPRERAAEVDRLVDHGEPAEGLCSLAWALHNVSASVPAWAVHDICELTEGLVAPEHMPPGMRT
jgi:hypothetical protein